MSREFTPRDLEIPEEAWTVQGSPTAVLAATLVVNGVLLHLEAWPVALDENDVQQAVDPDYRDEFGLLHAAVGADGPFQTMTLRGVEYALVAFPHS